MKNIFIISIILAFAFLANSCEDMFGDYLEKPPGIDLTDVDIFSSREQFDLYLAALYAQSLISPLPGSYYRAGNNWINVNTETNYIFRMCQTDEAQFPVDWYGSHTWNSGGAQTTNNQNDVLWPARWTAIRMLNVMLERIDDAPIDASYNLQVRAETRFLRAQVYFDLFKFYSGVPIVTDKFLPDEVADIDISRSTVEEVIDFIVEECDFAIQNLPDRYPANWHGRATKGAALALKSRVLLYAASPLYNTAEPILSMDDPAHNSLICYGNYDVNRWQKAADAAKAVIDWAPLGGIRLITDLGPDKNYEHVWKVMDNDEVIFADKHNDGQSRTSRSAFSWIMPRPFGGLQGPLATQNFVQNFYYKRDGTPQNWQNSGQNVGQLYAELDYRFHQSIGYQDSYWNEWYPQIQLFYGPPHGEHYVNNITGYYVRKQVPDHVNGHHHHPVKNFIWYRLAEAYLNYAEALNEMQGPVAEAYNAVNIIRNRSGMPNLPSGLSQEEFRERVHQERTVELAFEDHRFFDIRRWVIAHHEGVAAGSMYGLRIKRRIPPTNPQTYNYERYVFMERTFPLRYYRLNFRIAEINKGYLVQNPGW
jgi:starch-binding outer membrane protein, SusD/RagB family